MPPPRQNKLVFLLSALIVGLLVVVVTGATFVVGTLTRAAGAAQPAPGVVRPARVHG
jgi:hypothetical protein